MTVPGADEPFLYFPYVAARQLESEHAGSALYDAEFQPSYGAENGEVKVRYKIGSRDADVMEAIFRFIPDGEGMWRLHE